MCMSSVKSYRALYALRFLVGLFEYVFLTKKIVSRLTIFIPGLDSTPVFTIFWDHGTRPKKLVSDP